MNERDAIYLAGILDGEGCVSLGVRKRIYVTPTLQVTNTDRRLTDWLLCTLGGSVYDHRETRPGRKQCYLWSIAGAKARNIIREVRPYLRLKDKQADIILSLATIDRKEIPRDGKTGKLLRLSPDYHVATAHAVSLIRALNWRGQRQ